MLGAIAGDVIGMPWEGKWDAEPGFPLFLGLSRFTDDSILTAALADWLMSGGRDLADAYREAWRRYPVAGFGPMFKRWALGEITDYASFGNGSAMRVSPVGWVASSLDAALELARESALPTHAHPEGIRGAEAVGGAVYLARTTRDKDAVLEFVRERMGYELVADARLMRDPKWFATCQVTVPAAFVALERGEDFESTIRAAVLLGGDTDTVAAMAGSVAEALHGGVPTGILAELLPRLDPWLTSITQGFIERHVRPAGYYRQVDWSAPADG